MWKRSFELKPLRLNRPIRISSELIRSPSVLDLQFRVEGHPDSLPEVVFSTENLGRKDGLWKTTCFELFLRVERSDAYFEWNLSLDGFWQCYRFSGERSGQTLAVVSPPRLLSFDRSSTHFNVHWVLAVPDELTSEPLFGHPTSVIENVDGSLDYFAPTHPKQTADFHDSRNFVRLSP